MNEPKLTPERLREIARTTPNLGPFMRIDLLQHADWVEHEKAKSEHRDAVMKQLVEALRNYASSDAVDGITILQNYERAKDALAAAKALEV